MKYLNMNYMYASWVHSYSFYIIIPFYIQKCLKGPRNSSGGYSGLDIKIKWDS